MGQESTGRSGSWGNDRATGRATGSGPRGWNPDAGRGRGLWVGGHQAAQETTKLSSDCFLEGLQALRLQLLPRLLGQGRPLPPRTRAHGPTIPLVLDGHRQPGGGLAHPRWPPPCAPPPWRPGTPRPAPRDPTLQGTVCLGTEQASRRPGKRKHDTAP